MRLICVCLQSIIIEKCRLDHIQLSRMLCCELLGSPYRDLHCLIQWEMIYAHVLLTCLRSNAVRVYAAALWIAPSTPATSEKARIGCIYDCLHAMIFCNISADCFKLCLFCRIKSFILPLLQTYFLIQSGSS